MFRRVEAEAQRLYAEIPATLGLKTTELKNAKKRQTNLVAFVVEGAVTRLWPRPWPSLSRRATVSQQVASLRRASDKVIRVPSLRWIRQRLSQVRSVLEARTPKSAALLRRLLCSIRMEPVSPPNGRPYFVARTAPNTRVLLDDPESEAGSDSGATSLPWWTRRSKHNAAARVRST